MDIWLTDNFPTMTAVERKAFMQQATSVDMPSSLHTGVSETFAGRNTLLKRQMDASDLYSASESNINAYVNALRNQSYTNAQIEAFRQSIHARNSALGLYE